MFKTEIINRIKALSPHQVKVAIVDIDGVLRGKYMQTEKFLSALENGFGFCNVAFGWDCGDVCYDNASYTGWHTGYPDAEVAVDLDSYRTIPWEQQMPFFLGNLVRDGNKPLAICPRNLLVKAISDLESLGFSATVGFEFEWFNFRETPQSLHDKQFTNLQTLTPGMFGYSLLRTGLNQEFCRDLLENLRQFDTALEGLHTETGPGVYEGAFGKAPAMAAADRAVLGKLAIKQIALNHGLIASFMSRWNNSLPGCGGHMHVSLNQCGGKPVFFDANDPQKMSKTFRSFLAGVISFLPEMLPLFAPTVNSYKRLVEGFWAPTRATWGIDNRTTAFRVIPASASSTRLEVRVGGADINPYLALAATLAAGAYGIKNNRPLIQAPIKGSSYASQEGERLASNLRDATEILNRSESVRGILGDSFVDHFVATRHFEWQQYQKAVTDWELKRYFEII